MNILTFAAIKNIHAFKFYLRQEESFTGTALPFFILAGDKNIFYYRDCF